MGIYDRDYTHDNYNRRGPSVRFVMPPLTPVVKYLLIANIIIFILTFLVPAIDRLLLTWFSVFPADIAWSLQIWRLISYQFLHGGIGHVFFNMLILYFFGPMLESFWGSNRFLRFYLICGAMGGVLYTVFVNVGFMEALPLIGASGAIYGMLAAGAILFPNMKVYIWGIIPMPLPLLAVIIAVISFLGMMRGANAGGDAAHLAGMAAGAVYVLWKPWQQKIKINTQQGAWGRKMQSEKNFHAEVDRILGKVQAQGINSLTRKEKQILQQATKREQQNG